MICPISNEGMTLQPIKEMQQVDVHVFDFVLLMHCKSIAYGSQ